jgi:hypothetical protein
MREIRKISLPFVDRKYNRLLFLRTLLLWASGMASVGPTESLVVSEISPLETDPSITRFNDPNYVVYDRQGW